MPLSRKPVRHKLCRSHVLVSHLRNCTRQLKVSLLQAGISALDDADTVENEHLERALLRAQTQAVVPPVSAQIASTKGFIEREKKRLVVAKEVVKIAVRNRDECLDVLQAEKRFEEFQAQEKSPFAPVPDPEVELSRLRAQVAELQESTSVVDRRTTHIFGFVETMPALVPAELSVWMENRQADVQEALIKGDHSRVIELSSLLTKAAERMVEMSHQDISDDEFRSRSVRPLLTERCSAMYGLRGDRVGEASHPGPPKSRRRIEDSLSVPSSKFRRNQGSIRCGGHWQVESTPIAAPFPRHRRCCRHSGGRTFPVGS